MSSGSIIHELEQGNFEKCLLRKAILSKGNLQKELFELSRQKRTKFFPHRKTEIRSVIEISNICCEKCNFCNINSCSKIKKRYTLSYHEIIRIVEYIHAKGRKVILLQSGERQSQKYIDFVCKCIYSLKERFYDLIIILCMGDLSYKQYSQLRENGADRYILKFETSNPALYRKIKPGGSLENRIKCIDALGKLNFDTGSGNIIGLPGQTLDDIINDLIFIGQLKLTMASTSVFIAGEGSKYSRKPNGDLNLTLNYMALMRIMYPQFLIPSTSSLEKAGKNGQFLGLMAGANTVTIHDGTPAELKAHFPIYSLHRFTPSEEYISNIVTMANLSY
jgi:biotin synthase